MKANLLLSICLLVNYSLVNSCRSHDHKILLEGKEKQVQRLDFPVNQPRELESIEPSQLPNKLTDRELFDESICYAWKDVTQVKS